MSVKFLSTGQALTEAFRADRARDELEYAREQQAGTSQAVQSDDDDFAEAAKPDLSDDECDARIAAVDKKESALLGKYARKHASAGGYMGVREGSSTWLKFARKVIRDLHQADMKFSDIEE